MAVIVEYCKYLIQKAHLVMILYHDCKGWECEQAGIYTATRDEISAQVWLKFSFQLLYNPRGYHHIRRLKHTALTFHYYATSEGIALRLELQDRLYYTLDPWRRYAEAILSLALTRCPLCIVESIYPRAFLCTRRQHLCSLLC
jgi:hypothetical protein